MICRIWNFVAFIGIVSTSTDYSSLRLVQFFAENDILIGVGSSLCVDLLLIQLFGSVLDRFVLGENIGLRVRISCYLRLHHACCFARIVSHAQPEICVERLYHLFAIGENSGSSKVCDNSHRVCVWSSLFVANSTVEQNVCSISACF